MESPTPKFKEEMMASRAEIREGIYDIIEDFVMCKTLHTGAQIDELIKDIQTFEDSQGVVLKVERKELEGCDIVSKTNAICPYKEAGGGFFEPLIEEER